MTTQQIESSGMEAIKALIVKQMEVVEQLLRNRSPKDSTLLAQGKLSGLRSAAQALQLEESQDFQSPQYPNETEPYIWLQEEEEEGSADCGCRLEQDNGAKLTLCTMHAAAEELLEALADLASVLSMTAYDSATPGTKNYERWNAAYALVRRAKGQP